MKKNPEHKPLTQALWMKIMIHIYRIHAIGGVVCKGVTRLAMGCTSN